MSEQGVVDEIKIEDYQDGTSQTAKMDNEALINCNDDELNETLQRLNWALGLAGEAGEFADLVKKQVFHGHEHDRDEIIDELGDILWYVSETCNINDISIREVMENNLEKLGERYPDGFSKEDSRNRDKNSE